MLFDIMKYSVYRFNYNSNLNRVEFPDTDPIPQELIDIVIMPHRFLLECESFELLRLRFEEGLFIIHKYALTPVYIGQIPYYFTLRCS